MKIVDIDDAFRLTEDALYEMSTFRNSVTGLPTNLDIWVRSDPLEHGHSRYRVKIRKDKDWSAIFTVGQFPKKVKSLDKNELLPNEETQIKKFIARFSSLLISLIDCKITTSEFEEEVKKARG